MEQISRRRLRYYPAIVISLITLVVYLPVLGNDFIGWDDDLYIIGNHAIRSFDWVFFKWAFSSFYAGNWHPLTWASHALDYAVWRLNPIGHHLSNVLFHAINTFLVMLLCLRLFEAWGKHSLPPDTSIFRGTRGVAIAVAVTGLLFGLHPMHVESVAWASERKDLLCGLFLLLSMIAYLTHAEHVHDLHEAPFLSRAYVLSLTFFVFALLSKSMAVTLPFVLLILDWQVFQRLQSRKLVARALLEKLPFVAVSAVVSIVTLLAQKTFGAVAGIETFPLEARILVALQSLMLYLWNMICPLRLSPFYPYPLRSEVTFFSFPFLAAAIFVIGITAFALCKAKRRGLWLSVWAYFVITLLPVIGIVQVGRQAMADRYSYLPSLGPFLLAGLASTWIWRKVDLLKHWRVVARIFVLFAAGILIIFLSVLTIRQIGVWKNSIVLWSAVIDREPERAPFAYYNRGVAFRDRGQRDRAVADYSSAIALDPTYFSAYANRGLVLMETGQLDRAIADFTSAIALNRSLYQAYNNRGLAYKKSGQLDAALRDYDAALSLKPDYADAYINRGSVFSQKGDRDQAMQDYNRAIDFAPSFAAYINRGILRRELGMFDQAIGDYTKALALNPGYGMGYRDRGDLYFKTGNTEFARRDFQAACDLGIREGCEALLRANRVR